MLVFDERRKNFRKSAWQVIARKKIFARAFQGDIRACFSRRYKAKLSLHLFQSVLAPFQRGACNEEKFRRGVCQGML